MRTRSDQIDQNAPAHRVMACFGGLTEYAKALEVPITTAHRWLKNGLIPADRQEATLIAARTLEIEIDPIIFVPIPEAA